MKEETSVNRREAFKTMGVLSVASLVAQVPIECDVAGARAHPSRSWLPKKLPRPRFWKYSVWMAKPILWMKRTLGLLMAISRLESTIGMSCPSAVSLLHLMPVPIFY